MLGLAGSREGFGAGGRQVGPHSTPRQDSRGLLRPRAAASFGFDWRGRSVLSEDMER